MTNCVHCLKERTAAKARAEEREACAKLADELGAATSKDMEEYSALKKDQYFKQDEVWHRLHGRLVGCVHIAETIRARGEPRHSCSCPFGQFNLKCSCPEGT